MNQGQKHGGGGSHSRGSGAASTQTASAPPLFDPAKPRAELVDTLAEEQACRFPDGPDRLNSSQLRRFFGEVKDLLKRLDAGRDYKTEIEPMFKMLRSKASYAYRNGQNNKIPEAFHEFIKNGVNKVTDEEQFRLFVQHFEAVVGFLYGTRKVSSKS